MPDWWGDRVTIALADFLMQKSGRIPETKGFLPDFLHRAMP